MTAAARLEQRAPAPAEELAQRTAKAVEYGCRNMATDLATFLEQLELPDNDPVRLAIRIEDATEVYMRSLSYAAAYSYGLCLLLLPDVIAAGKRFRDADVQDELRASAMRVALTVMEKP